jgi:hypothetical protein
MSQDLNLSPDSMILDVSLSLSGQKSYNVRDSCMPSAHRPNQNPRSDSAPEPEGMVIHSQVCFMSSFARQGEVVKV